MPAPRAWAYPIRACGRHPSAPARNLHFERTFCVPPIMAQKTRLLPYKSPYGDGFSISERFGASPPPFPAHCAAAAPGLPGAHDHGSRVFSKFATPAPRPAPSGQKRGVRSREGAQTDPVGRFRPVRRPFAAKTAMSARANTVFAAALPGRGHPSGHLRSETASPLERTSHSRPSSRSQRNRAGVCGQKRGVRSGRGAPQRPCPARGHVRPGAASGPGLLPAEARFRPRATSQSWAASCGGCASCRSRRRGASRRPRRRGGCGW